MKYSTFIIIILLSGCASIGNYDEIGITKILTGNWEWEGSDECKTNPHTLRFTNDLEKMVLSYKHKVHAMEDRYLKTATYTIHKITPKYLTVYIDNEVRKDDKGNDVVWDLVLVSNDEYYWYRHDWDEGKRTKSNFRCK